MLDTVSQWETMRDNVREVQYFHCFYRFSLLLFNGWHALAFIKSICFSLLWPHFQCKCCDERFQRFQSIASINFSEKLTFANKWRDRVTDPTLPSLASLPVSPIRLNNTGIQCFFESYAFSSFYCCSMNIPFLPESNCYSMLYWSDVSVFGSLLIIDCLKTM